MPLDLTSFDDSQPGKHAPRTPGQPQPRTQPAAGAKPDASWQEVPVGSKSTSDGWVEVPVGAQPDADGWVEVPVPEKKLDLSGFDSTASAGKLNLSAFDARDRDPPVGNDGWIDVPVDGQARADIEGMAARETSGIGIVGHADLEEIGRAHGVDPAYLRDWVGWLSGTLAPADRRGTEHFTESAKSVAGVMSSAIPAQLAKKWGVESEDKRRALDDLADLIDERKSVATKVGEAAAGMALPAVGSVSKFAPAALRGAVAAGEAAGVGGAFGYAGSHEGDELASTLAGAGIGLGFGGLAAGLGHLATRASRAAGEAAPAVERAVAEAADDTAAVARKSYVAAEEPEKALERVVLDMPEVRKAARTRDVGKFVESTSPEARSAIARLATEETAVSPRISRQLGDETARAWSVARDTVEEFDARLGVGSRRGGVRDVVAQEGREHVAAKFRGMREADYLRRELARAVPDAGRPGFLGKATAWFSDMRFVTDAIDGRLGTRLTPVIDRMSAQYNRFTADMADVAKLQSGLNKLLLRAEKTPTRTGEQFDLYRALESAPRDMSQYTQEQKVAIDAWRAGFETLRQRANELGVPVRKLTDAGYVPHRAVDATQYIQRMEAAGEKLGVSLSDEASQAAVLVRAKSGDTQAQEYLQGLRLVSGGDPVETPTQIRAAIRSMEDVSRAGHRLETVAGSSLSRESEAGIPTFLRETDPTKLFQQWAHSTFRHARLRHGLDEIRSAADAIRDANPEAAGYLDRYVEDLVGVRAGSAAAAQGEWLTRFQILAARRARTSRPGSAQQMYWRMAGRLPDALPFMAAQIYPYALGMKASKLTQNLLSPVVLGMPTLGIRNSHLVIQGVADLIRVGPREMARILRREGLAPADQPFEAHRWLAEGLERSPLKRYGRGALEAVNKLAMHMYQKTDDLTRGVTYFAARRLAEDMRRGVPRALEALDRMGPGYAASVREQLARGEDVSREVAAWLNGYTQFNYNRAAMSEYGRFMGSLFSTFSKWPTSIAGDFAGHIDRGTRDGKLPAELMKLGWKYLGPWLALLGAQRVLLEPAAESTPELEAVVGRDITAAAPGSSLRSLLKGDLAGPLPRAAGEVASAATSDEPEKLGAALLRNMAPFMPGGVVLRFYYDDLPTWRGESTAGKTETPMRRLLEDLGITDPK